MEVKKYIKRGSSGDEPLFLFGRFTNENKLPSKEVV
jgi:hypothetical protein